MAQGTSRCSCLASRRRSCTALAGVRRYPSAESVSTPLSEVFSTSRRCLSDQASGAGPSKTTRRPWTRQGCVEQLPQGLRVGLVLLGEDARAKGRRACRSSCTGTIRCTTIGPLSSPSSTRWTVQPRDLARRARAPGAGRRAPGRPAAGSGWMLRIRCRIARDEGRRRAGACSPRDRPSRRRASRRPPEPWPRAPRGSGSSRCGMPTAGSRRSWARARARRVGARC